MLKVSAPSVPLAIPPSAITPLKVVLAPVMMRVLDPSLTLPTPASLAKVVIDVLVVTPEISKILFAVTLLELAILPLPLKAKVPPLILVVPVYVLAALKVVVPVPAWLTFTLLPAKIAETVAALPLVLLKV